jgi:hypothetical protein
MTISYSSDQLKAFPWIISSGTLKLEDLIPAAEAALQQILGSLHRPPFTLSSNVEQLLLVANSCASSELSSYAFQRRSSNLDILAEGYIELSELLEDLAPVGFTYGSHSGDGALMGFWLSDYIESDIESIGINLEDPELIVEWFQDLIKEGIDIEDIESSHQCRLEATSYEDAGRLFAIDCAESSGIELSPPNSSGWPIDCIDWNQAWQELRSDGYIITRAPDSAGLFDVWLP